MKDERDEWHGKSTECLFLCKHIDKTETHAQHDGGEKDFSIS